MGTDFVISKLIDLCVASERAQAEILEMQTAWKGVDAIMGAVNAQAKALADLSLLVTGINAALKTQAAQMEDLSKMAVRSEAIEPDPDTKH